MAFPGTLPVLNKECLKMAIMMANVLHCKLPEYMYFERKNYYYPDLPKGYQITQNPPEDPIDLEDILILKEKMVLLLELKLITYTLRKMLLNKLTFMIRQS